MSIITGFRPATKQERMYTYRQSQELTMKTGSIGYLRGDFDSSGCLFYTTWFDTVPLRNTAGFKAELDQVVDALRNDPEYHGILAGRGEMSKYCRTQPDSAMTGNYTTEYAFRTDTDDFVCLMRLNPTKGDYNFYISCFQKEWLDRHLKAAGKGIRFITSYYEERFRIEDGDKIRMRMSDGTEKDETVRYIDDYHIQVGAGSYDNIYHICEFAEITERNGTEVIPLRMSLPEQCYSTLPSSGRVILIKRGEPGYYPVDMKDEGPEGNRAFVDARNGLDHVSPAQEAAMSAGSVFGWDAPAADPENYDEEGLLIRTGRAERAEAR